MAKQTKGFCKYCGKEYTRGGMLRHLATCKNRKERLDAETGKSKCGYFQVVIYGKYDKDYWLIVEINENATLKEVDQFIRDIWVECCGHLSSFDIHGIQYDVQPCTDSFWGPPTKSMNYKLKDVFTVGDAVGYEYDFGSTTELILSIHSHRVGERKRGKIVILSRNNPPEIICSQCGKNKARWVNPECYYGGSPFWCVECLEKSDIADGGPDEYCETDFFLPIWNSPRMGVCGYGGSDRYPEQFQPDKISVV